MKLATTTGDFRLSSDEVSEVIKLYDSTGFRYLDLNLYRSIYPGSPLLDERWERWFEGIVEAAAVCGSRFCQAHAPDGDPFAAGEEMERYGPITGVNGTFITKK